MPDAPSTLPESGSRGDGGVSGAPAAGTDTDGSGDHSLPQMRFGREISTDIAAGEAREWLVTNGQGGYASSSLAGMPTRGYHGLLVAALAPPLGRTVKLVTVLETVECGDERIELATVRWRGGTVAPDGRVWLDSLRFEGTTPVWRFAGPRFVIDKRLTMDRDGQVTRIDYTAVRCAGPLRLEVGVVADHRDYHGRTFADGPPLPIRPDDGSLEIAAPDGDGAASLHVSIDGATAKADGQWYRGFDLAEERARGLTDSEDHLHAGTLTTDLEQGATAQLVASVGARLRAEPRALAAAAERESALLASWRAARGPGAAPAPEWIERLVLAADQFIVGRRLRDGTPVHSVIAGYHWFSDWGRDTMISLQGLAIETGRPEIARSVLLVFADAVDGGMIPNRFPDAGDTPEFNTVDATLWFFEAIAGYHAATGDEAFLEQIFPVLAEIVAHHARGTRYGIRVDAADGLLRAGEAGVQLTWMDARVGDWVVTPRIGKPVEVNALWVAALRTVGDIAARVGRPDAEYRELRKAAQAGFGRYWNPERGYLFDVLDGPEGDDPALRPNQIFAARPRAALLTPEQARAVVTVCETELLTPAGLRSLGPREAGYVDRYGGDQTARDSAYHQGTVWPYLLGAFVEAHLGVHRDAERAAEILAPIADHMRVAGAGTVSEIFEAAPPHAPRGCIAQAWSVAEVLRAWQLVDRFRTGTLRPGELPVQESRA